MVAGSALLVCSLATLASSFAPIVAPRAAATTVGAAPRWVDGPGDIEEAARVSKFTSNAVSVLYFSALASTHASALSTFELLAAALPRPGGGGGGGGPASPSDGAKFFNIAEDLWERSADSRNDPNFRGKAAKKEIEGLKKKFDQMARDMGKDTAEAASGGETKRAKLDRLFAMDADSSDAPADENLSDFDAFLENRRKGGTDADFYAKQKGAEDEPGAGDDYDRLGKIRHTPPSK
ncbi:hypothetical protein JL720_16514 [Aureococcus anophagefferens]|nr:hypothetical protein JL720_16514 [Aureococcus anophagefferens]